MPLPKPFVQAVDLADLKRQLSDAAVRLPAKAHLPVGASAASNATPAPSKVNDDARAERPLVGPDRRIRVIDGGRHQNASASTGEPSLISPSPVSPSLSPSLISSEAPDAAPAEHALIAGLTETQLGTTGGGNPVAPATPVLPSPQNGPLGNMDAPPADLRSGQPDAHRRRVEFEDRISGALRTDPLPAGTEPGGILRAERRVDHAPSPASNGRSDPFFGDDPRHPGRGAPLPPDSAAGVAALQHAAPARRASPRRSVVSRTARSLAVPLLFVAGGAAAVIYADPEVLALSANDAPVKAEPANLGKAPSQAALAPTGSPDKPDQSVVAGQSERVAAPPPAPPGDADSSKEAAPTSAGRAVAGNASASNASDAPAKDTLAKDTLAKTQPAGLVPSPVPDLPPPARSAAVTAPELAMGSASGPAADPPAPPTRKATVSVPLDGPRPAAQRPAQPAQAEPLAAAPASAPTSVNPTSGTGSALPAAKRPALASRAQSTAVIAATDPQTPTAAPTKAGGEVDKTARGGSDTRAPSSAPPRALPERMADAGAAQSARPAALRSQLHPNPSSGSWIGVASSSSESDARGTLAQLEKRFPGQLGAASIRRDDRGGAGVLYRVRTGPLSLEAAAKVCSVVRAAGKICVLTNG